jgi:cellulose biosynthesis protein BcsQ
MKILVFNEKGGAGKTTLAVSLAVKLQLPLLDLDAQATASRWLERRTVKHAIADELSSDFVADCRPGLSVDLSPFLAAADLVIVPVRASFSDLVTLSDTLKFVALHNSKVALCGADIDTRSSDLELLSDALKVYDLPFLGLFSHRASYRRAGLSGQTAAELDKVAALELDVIVNNIRKFLK